MTGLATEASVDRTFEHKPAGFWVRFFAYLIDVLLINVVLVGLFVRNIFVYSNIESFTIAYISLYSIVAGIVFYIYFILMTKFFGQTLGKMIFGLKVVSDSGKELTWSTVLFREAVGRFISVVVKVLYLIVPFTQKHKAVHDFIADTHVVHEKTYSKKVEEPSKTTSTSLKERYNEDELNKSESKQLQDKEEL